MLKPGNVRVFKLFEYLWRGKGDGTSVGPHLVVLVRDACVSLSSFFIEETGDIEIC